MLRLADPDRSGSVDVNELTDLLYDVEMAAAAETDEDEEAGSTRSSVTVGGRGGGGKTGAGGRRNSTTTANERVERLLWQRASEKWS